VPHKLCEAAMTDQPAPEITLENLVIPALLRHSRTTYGEAMHAALAAAGYDDIPANGMYVIGGLALGAGDAPLGRLVKELKTSKQAAGQLIDTLVLRGYVERTPDAEDRRKLTVTLTERGKAAAAIQAGMRQRIDAALTMRVGEETVSQGRRMLAALVAMGRNGIGDGAVAGYCRSVMPILPTTDIARTQAFYRSLGFAMNKHSDEFLMVARDAIELAFGLNLQHDPKTTAGCVYIRVTSADALYEAWKGIEGVKAPVDQDYKMRDLPVGDPDNNLLLFGSPIP
jgi:DNA-binding MarR family transcriptional regulator/catechol 2,3-dioxygenase-like lactoylglutathione lyase family enzyme